MSFQKFTALCIALMLSGCSSHSSQSSKGSFCYPSRSSLSLIICAAEAIHESSDESSGKKCSELSGERKKFQKVSIITKTTNLLI
jgi:hypothetical protein